MKKEIACLICSFVSFANAQVYTLFDNSFEQSTYLIDIATESNLNQKARSLREGGYETSGGQTIDFYNWYSPKIPEMHVSWMTQIDRSFGIIWGVGSGEKADKYTIAPSLRFGILYVKQIGRNQSISVMADTYFGGELNEQSCFANYGEIGGIREVNCRLAATELPPEETLNYLEHGSPGNSLHIEYKLLF